MNRYRPGDVLSRRKGIVMHRGVALGNGLVLHNTPLEGEHISSEAEFSQGHRIFVNEIDDAHRRSVLERAERSGGGYHLFDNNCEHTVTRVVTGEASSPQLRGMLGGILAGTLVLAVTRSPSAAVASFAAARAWLSRD